MCFCQTKKINWNWIIHNEWNKENKLKLNNTQWTSVPYFLFLSSSSVSGRRNTAYQMFSFVLSSRSLRDGASGGRKSSSDVRRGGCALDDGSHEKASFIGESSESWLFSTDFSWTQNARTSKRHVLVLCSHSITNALAQWLEQWHRASNTVIPNTRIPP